MSDDDDPLDFSDDNSRFSGRMKRYAKVGTSVGGLAAQVVGNRVFGLGLDRGRHSSELKKALGGLKGPLMKAAQILATIPDALPKEYAEELRQLQSNAPEMGWLFVKRRMQSELGAGWQKKFARFDQKASAAASLGQVHEAESHDGVRLACKLQYPDMISAVEADLKQLGLLFGIYRRYDKAIDPSNVHKELSERLREELDYLREAQNMKLYRHMLRDEERVFVPEDMPELSSRRLLTMNWLEGEPLLDFIQDHEGDQGARNQVAMNMFRAWYVPFYEYGVIHGDPHLGNYSIRPNGDVNLLDFGCIRIFDPSFVKGVIDLYYALERNDEALAVEAYESWGFDLSNKEMLDILNIWAQFLYGPLLQDRKRSIVDDHKGGAYGAEIANKVHRELRRIGGVKPPREFVLMDRAAVGLGSVFMHLKAEVNWHQLFHDLIGDFDYAALKARQSVALQQCDLSPPSLTE
ncbi:ABC1 kinase family protein [Kiloniella laminariae]|uniref:ABC1 kinase family protein n=1 Tax=Kiloniella laminariae TaxID=454162 RepID=UPI0003643110|nr:AarF/UbiB family protein [Kiloniella laminariae]